MYNIKVMLRVAKCVLVVICLAFTGAHAQPILPALLKSSDGLKKEKAEEEINRFTTRLADKKSHRNEEQFLQLIFSETHRRYLKNYKPYSQFSDIFEKKRGNYDCLSATSLLAVMLDTFGYKFHIIETNYHIFISVQTNSGAVLLESTDRLNGFVTDPEQIRQRITAYKQNSLQAGNSDRVYYQFDLNLYQIVQPHQLAGLLFFNQAIDAFNRQDLINSADKLKQSVHIYNSPRTSEFAAILVTAIAHSSIADETKKDLIRPFAKYIRNTTVAVR